MVAVDCPSDLQPRNAAAAIKAAAAANWKWECLIYAGFDQGSADLIWTVAVKVKRDGVRMVGLWEGPAKDDLGWYRGWRLEARRLTALNWGEFSNAIKGTTPVPTAKQENELAAELRELLAAMQMFRPIAEIIGVLPTGTKDRPCKGKVFVGAIGLPFLPCGNRTTGDPICDSCTIGMLVDGTVEAKPASKKKTKEKENTGDLT